MSFRLAPISIVPKVRGKIKPFNDPAKINNVTGCPIKAYTIVENTIKPIITKLLYFSNNG